MEFVEPILEQFTIYSKSGCPNCKKVKTLLEEKKIKFTVIDCDDYIVESKEDFLEFIKKHASKEIKQFPITFDNKKFIGGFLETKIYIEKELDFDLFF